MPHFISIFPEYHQILRKYYRLGYRVPWGSRCADILCIADIRATRVADVAGTHQCMAMRGYGYMHKPDTQGI